MQNRQNFVPEDNGVLSLNWSRTMRYFKTCLIAVATATTLFYSSTSLSVDKFEIYGFFPSKWSSNTIPVCWENPSSANAEGRKWTKEAIKETWERHSRLNFTGWSQCHNRSMGIRIFIDDDGPHTKGLGSQLDGRRNGMVLNFTFNHWNRACRRSLSFCIKVIAVHEFGHALGFAHEQNRPDAPRECQKERQGGDGDVYLSEYDPESVMNYCNPEWSGGGTLSRKDIEGLQKWYGEPTTQKPVQKPVQKPAYKPATDRNEEKTFFRIVNVSANDVLNIRYLSHPRSKKVGKIPHNKGCIAYLNQTNYYKSRKWVKISYQGAQGWVNSKFVRRDENLDCSTFYQVINVDDNDVLNLRQSSNFRSRKVGTIPSNACCILKLDETYANKKWLMVRYNSTIGWVHSHYLMQQTVGFCDSCQ